MNIFALYLFSSVDMYGLIFRAFSMCLAPSGPISLSPNSITCRDVLIVRALAMCLAPSGPILLFHKSITCRDVLHVKALAMCLAPSSPI